MKADYALRKAFERLKKAFPMVKVSILGNAVHIGAYLRMVVTSEHTMHLQVLDSSNMHASDQPAFLAKRTSVKQAIPNIDVMLYRRHLYDVVRMDTFFQKDCLTMHPVFTEEGVLERVMVMYHVRLRTGMAQDVFAAIYVNRAECTEQSLLVELAHFKERMRVECEEQSKLSTFRNAGVQLITETRPDLLPFYACPRSVIDGYIVDLDIATDAFFPMGAQPEHRHITSFYTNERSESRNVYVVNKESSQ